MPLSNQESSTSEVLALRWRVTELEEQLALRDHKLGLAVKYDSAKGARILQLEAELTEWRKLRDPHELSQLLIDGVPARLDLQQIERLLVHRQLEAERGPAQ